MDTQYKNIFSIRIAKRLIALGEQVYRISPNRNQKNHTVFTFVVSPTFDENMKKAIARD